MSRRYKGAIISATPPTTTGGESGTAPGEWTLQQQMQAQGGSVWPSQPLPKYIEDYFSTYLYTGTGAARTIVNGIDLATKGGMIWIKDRTTATNHNIEDTVQGITKNLVPNSTAAAATVASGDDITSFNTNGWSFGNNNLNINNNGDNFASWTWAKAPKFFDVVTYTGTSSVQNIAHNLGSIPGCIIIKRTNSTSNWAVYHRGTNGGTNPQNYFTLLSTTDAQSSATAYWDNTAPTDTQFTVGGGGIGNVNYSGSTYVAYIFAHNAGGFGLTGTDNVISCGSYVGTGAVGNAVTLGYEPQWLMVKNVTSAFDWIMYDNMRGMPASDVNTSNTKFLRPNTSGAEAGGATIIPTATGFQANTGYQGANFSAETYIYIAIRRGPMAVPTDATKVFTPVTDVSSTTNIAVSTTNQVDMIWSQPVLSVGGDNISYEFDRLRGVSALVGTSFRLSGTNAEASPTGLGMGIDQNTGYVDNWFYNQGFTSRTIANWTFRRAPSFFDEVCYTGTASATTFNHNLGAVPELMIMKSRSATTGWYVYSSALGNTYHLVLNTTAAGATPSSVWNSTTPTSTVFTLGNTIAANDAGATYVAYLFATCAGVSKVGSYSGTGATQTINCGFTGGARFVMIKRTDSTGDWYIWDTARGMVSGTDPYLLLNVQSSQVNANNVYTTTGGFQIVGTGAGFNASGGSYIFLAIA